MFRRCLRHARRISYVTDVEGDFTYFQRFVCLSRVLRWEQTEAAASSSPPRCPTGGSNASKTMNGRWAPLSSSLPPAASMVSQTSNADANRQTLLTSSTTTTIAAAAAAAPSACEAEYYHLVDPTRYRLGFHDDTSHFVFGGDAFDHGCDITMGTILLDFKRRFPSRVHLILGNRDINKIIMYPRMAREINGMTPDAAEDSIFQLPPALKNSVPAASPRKSLRYRDFLLKRQRRRQEQQRGSPLSTSSGSWVDEQDAGDASETLCADAVSFLEWALENKFGGPNTFEHRRQELRELAAMAAEGSETVPMPLPEAGAGTTQDSGASPEDALVAASFFEHAQPGGIFYEYIRAGVLSVVLDGVVFVHGGINDRNAGFVPSLEATTYAEQITAGQWWLPEVAPEGVATVRKAPSATSALDWLAALEEFKDRAFLEWASGTALHGEALRAYAYPRFVAPHSIVVGTVINSDGPHHIPLTVVAYLLQSGIHTVCTGHQPVGDTPAIVREPGGFMIVNADNSYCGRGNRFSIGHNKRGAAVMELLFNHPVDSDGHVGAHNTAAAPSLVAHGYRADGTPFEFDLYGDRRIGRHVGDGWWVRLPPEATTPASSSPVIGGKDAHAELYELRRTRNGFRDEETRWATGAEVDEWLREAAASGRAVVSGELGHRYSKEELAEVRPRRLKTKVKRM